MKRIYSIIEFTRWELIPLALKLVASKSIIAASRH